MAGRYDEWAAARTPALLRLAHALTGDSASAEDAVRRALARTRDDWPRVERDDPDLVVRRLLVRSCAGRDRAAVVLREAEHRSDAEIADVLGCSEAAARRHVARGLSAGEPAEALTSDTNPFGPGSGVGVGVAVLERREVDTGREPRRRGRAVRAAVLAVVLLVGGVTYVAHQSGTPAGVITYPSVHAPQTWRYESYAGVQVQVPASWGWGGAPLRSGIFHGKDSLGSCGSAQAAVQSAEDPSSYISAATGFTGRPEVMSDLCVSWGSDGTMPIGDALWFASPLEVGLRDVGGGVVAETRAVGDQHVTVFSAHSALRRQILGTAEEVDTDASGCPTQPVLEPQPGPDGMRPDSMSVCAYSQDSGAAVLLWSGRLAARSVQRYADALRESGTDHARCPAVPSGTWVALGLHGHGGTRWDLVDLRCDRIRGTGGVQWPLTRATVSDWARDGVTAYVPAPLGAAAGVDGYFRRVTG